MQRLFKDAYTLGWPDYETRLRNLKAADSGSPAALLAEFLDAGRLSLETLAKSADEVALNQAVQNLSRAQMIHVIGLRRAFPVATYLAYVFEKMNIPAMLHDGVGKLDHRHALREKDALIAITFAPYSDETLSLAQHAKLRGLPVVGLTDHLGSPLAQWADTILTVQEVDFGAFRSLSATIALSIALAVAVGAARG